MIFRTIRSFSTIAKQTPQIPIINTEELLKQTPKLNDECKKAAEALYKYGCLIIRDPRVNENHNNEFVDLMEKYFQFRGKQFYNKEKVPDVYPELGYQIGATPEFVEKARNHAQLIKSYQDGYIPQSPTEPVFDAKWRFFWRIGEQADKKANPVNCYPKEFPEWEPIMNKWGDLMLNGCLGVAEMAAIGLGLPAKTFVDRMIGGPHLLAPTASDLERYKVGTVFAGFHYDLNFLTIHGKSRFPGLYVWLRTGEKMPVVVPDGCLLLQAGKQLEILTGGYISAGYHEVIYTDKTYEAYLKAKQNGKITWRISSTLFSHIRSDVVLEPLGHFATTETKAKYTKQTAHEQVMEELKAISLVN